jgi:alkanesulfonate monooxygenase SsuD/methylene tetrahydromethanopterin reductase-like flavin-dependent oxidoreductase (luciferase family)
VDLDQSRAEVHEGIQVLKKAFTEDPFMFYGEHYKVPPRSLIPKPIQSPHPPMYMAATSPESHTMAAGLGIGVFSWSNYMGYEPLAESIAAYNKAADAEEADGNYVDRRRVGALLQAYCAESDEVAREEAGPGNVKWLQIALDGYPRLAKVAESYAYMAKVQEVSEKATNLEYFQESSGSAVFGSPESCIRSIEKLRDCGVDTLALRIDSVPHDKIMKSIEMFGRYVIPHFKSPQNFMRPPEDVMADIREMREEAKKAGVYNQPGEVV